MPHVSKKKLNNKTYYKIYNELLSHVCNSPSKKGRMTAHELLTNTERTMLAKRMAIIILLSRGYSLYLIQKELKISASTAGRYYRAIKAGKYESIIGKSGIKKNSIGPVVWDIIKDMLDPKVYISSKHRWRGLNKI